MSAFMKMTLELSHTPLPLRMSGMTFIKKPHKANRGDSRTYRPITLGPVLLKCLEKLMLNKLNEGHFRNKPLRPMQHAFYKGYSCDLALVEALDYIKSGIKQKDFVLGLSLDIEGAFDNVKPEYLIDALKKRKEPEWFNNIRDYLTYRTVAVTLNGKTVS